MNSLADLDPPLVAILRGITPAEVADVGAALVAAGLPVIEVTMPSPDSLVSIKMLAQSYGNEVLVGAGTVLRPAEVDAVAEAGGRIIVSPNFNPAVVARTKELGLYSMPGCLTPTEIFAALDAGADIIKVYPSDIATPTVISRYRAVLPKDTLIAVTGGVDFDNIAAYKKVGANAMGLGANLYKPGKSADDVKRDAERFVAAYRA